MRGGEEMESVEVRKLVSGPTEITFEVVPYDRRIETAQEIVKKNTRSEQRMLAPRGGQKCFLLRFDELDVKQICSENGNGFASPDKTIGKFRVDL